MASRSIFDSWGISPKSCCQSIMLQAGLTAELWACSWSLTCIGPAFAFRACQRLLRDAQDAKARGCSRTPEYLKTNKLKEAFKACPEAKVYLEEQDPLRYALRPGDLLEFNLAAEDGKEKGDPPHLEAYGPRLLTFS
eukprot:g23404.t1